MNDETQVGATVHKKRVGKHIAMVEGPPPTALERPKGELLPYSGSPFPFLYSPIDCQNVGRLWVARNQF